ncbi:hypothetical protein SAMN05660297_00111 [Natronincola peptidivorans]|uniref:Uncharacterized protein n=1 Tax=Natronincola peptidivorans TaxID=426128 RepID=A0A1H9Y9H2_9FIRM|nr:hypothetical protein [Natronincola peptidivorans]SES65477.1 hypothetical protein SAMN05660297_00111 [Natronincola peptidivorans]
MVKILGWSNTVLVAIMTLMYPLKKYSLASSGEKKRGKNGKVLEMYKKLRKAHPDIGYVIITIGLIHGYLAVGFLKWHSGVLVLNTIIMMALSVILGQRIKRMKSNWCVVHKLLSIALILFIINHIFR